MSKLLIAIDLCLEKIFFFLVAIALLPILSLVKVGEAYDWAKSRLSAKVHLDPRLHSASWGDVAERTDGYSPGWDGRPEIRYFITERRCSTPGCHERQFVSRREERSSRRGFLAKVG